MCMHKAENVCTRMHITCSMWQAEMAKADFFSIIVRSEQEEANWETETGKYPTTSCSSDLESSLGRKDYLQL